MMQVITLAMVWVMLADYGGPELKQSGQVLQRNAPNYGEALIALTEQEGQAETIKVIVRGQKGETLLEQTGKPEAGQDGLAIQWIPVGGPYQVTLEADGSRRTFEDIYVGDVWILAGQSNMQGVAPIEKPIDSAASIRTFTFDGKWQTARLPLHRFDNGAGAQYIERYGNYLDNEREKQLMASQAAGEAIHRAGPGLFFARAMQEQTSVPIGLIPCAWGGTNLEEWTPETRGQGFALFGVMMQRFFEAGGQVKGVLWYQGESDAFGGKGAVETYAERFHHFLEVLRKETHQPDLPVITVQIGRHVTTAIAQGTWWEQMREVQRQIAQKERLVTMAATLDLELSDCIHLSYPAQQRLGKRLALLARPLAQFKPAPQPGIQLAKVGYLDASRQALYVDFMHVNGRLQSEGRPHGFALRDSRNNPFPNIFQVRFDEQRPNRVLLFCHAETPPDAQLVYGPGFDPYANLTDSADQAVPGFGPIPLP